MLNIDTLNCYVHISDVEFQMIHDQLSTVSLGDRHFWNEQVIKQLDRKLTIPEIERFIEMGLNLDSNLEEVSFLNNYALYVKKIANQLPKLPIYDGQFRGRKDHKSRYTFDQISKLNDALEALEIDLDELNTFHTKFTHLKELQEQLDNAISGPTPKDVVRDVKRNCERSGVIMNHHLLHVEDVEIIQKQSLDGFSFYPSSTYKTDLDPNFRFIVPHSDVLLKIIHQLKYSFVFEDELDVGMHILEKCALSMENAKYLVNVADEYFSNKHQLQAVLQQSLLNESQIFVQIQNVLKSNILPNQRLLQEIVDILAHLKSIYQEICTSVCDYAVVSALSSLEALNSPKMDDLQNFISFITKHSELFTIISEVLEYKLNIGIKWMGLYSSYVNGNSQICFCGVKVDENAPYTKVCTKCHLVFHKECIQVKHDKSYVCGICKGDFHGISANCFGVVSKRFNDRIMIVNSHYKKQMTYRNEYEAFKKKLEVQNGKERRNIHALLGIPNKTEVDDILKIFKPFKPQKCPCGERVKQIWDKFKWCSFCVEIVHIRCMDKYGFKIAQDTDDVVCHKCVEIGIQHGVVYRRNKKVKIYSTELGNKSKGDAMDVDGKDINK